jgi:hypothetical protein
VKRSVIRGLVALVALLGVVLGVSACRVQPGAAAFVGDDKISESELSGYLNESAPATDTSGGTDPRTLVLSSLIREKLWTAYLDANGGVPSDSALAANRDAALAQAFRSGTAPNDQQLRDALEQIGVSASFAPVFTRESELLYAVVEKLTASNPNADVAKIITDAAPKVRLSPRYGTWDSSSLGPASGTPDYLQLEPATAS